MSSSGKKNIVQKYDSGEHSISIPKDTIEEEPIEVEEGVLNIEVGEGARVVFVDRCESDEIKISAQGGSALGGEVKVEVGSGAVVEYIILQNLESSADHVVSYRAEVAEGASMTWFDLELGGREVKTDIETVLTGERARAETWGVFFGTGETVYNINHVTKHTAAQTFSRMDTKGILDGQAKTVYRGCVEIPVGVAGCDAYERQDTLLLSKNAHVNSTPELLIGNNDVKCGHAVTTTRIDKDKLFYFESRGIAKEDAVRELAEGHILSIVDKLDNNILRNEIKKMIRDKISNI